MLDSLSQRGQMPDEPMIQIGIVLETDPVSGVCVVRLLNIKGDIIKIPYITPSAGSSGTLWDELATSTDHLLGSDLDNRLYDNNRYYTGQDTNSAYITEGQLYTIPEGAAVLILSSGDGHTLFEGGPMRVIIGCFNLTGLEVSRGWVAETAYFDPDDISKKWGFVSKKPMRKKRQRIDVDKTQIPDQVVFTNKELTALEEQNVIPLIPSDVFWQILQKAKNIPARLRKKLVRDAERLQGIYQLGGPGGNEIAPLDDILPEIIATETSECLIRITKQGKIIIGSDPQDVTCYSNEGSNLGCYFATGVCGGAKYAEIASTDWLFSGYRRGVTKFDRHWRIHGHLFSAATHQNTAPQQVVEDTILEKELPNGTEFTDVENWVLNANRSQLNVDGLQISCSPSQIFIGGKSLAEWLG